VLERTLATVKSADTPLSPPLRPLSLTWAFFSRQVAQAAQPNFLARHERLAVRRADGPTPVARPVAQIIEKRRRRARPTFDELGAVTGHGLHLGFEERRNVQDKRRPRVQTQVDDEIVE